MSPRRMTVQGQTAEIFCPGPDSFRIAPFIVLSRRAALLRRIRRVVRLRVVDQGERRPNGSPIRSRVLHAADAAGDAGDLDDRLGRFAAGDPGEDDVVLLPANQRALPLVRLAVAASRIPLEGPYWNADLGEVFAEQLVAVEFALDRFEHLRRAVGAGSDEHDVHVMPVEGRPQDRPFADRRLPAAARHRQGEQTAAEYCLLNAGNDLQVIVGPRERESLGEVGFEEEPQVEFAVAAAFRIRDRWQLAEVATFAAAFAAGFGHFLAVAIVAVGRRRLGWNLGRSWRRSGGRFRFLGGLFLWSRLALDAAAFFAKMQLVRGRNQEISRVDRTRKCRTCEWGCYTNVNEFWGRDSAVPTTQSSLIAGQDELFLFGAATRIQVELQVLEMLQGRISVFGVPALRLPPRNKQTH